MYEEYTTSTVEPASNGAVAIRFKVTKERLEQLTVDDLIELEEGQSIKALRNVLSLFVSGPDGYLDNGEALTLIGKMSIAQLNETAPQIMDQITEITAPK